jgi:hypothetical protein
MKDRRKRLVKLMYKKEGRLSDFEHGFKTLMNRRGQLIRKHTNSELEDMLREINVTHPYHQINLDCLAALVPAS